MLIISIHVNVYSSPLPHPTPNKLNTKKESAKYKVKTKLIQFKILTSACHAFIHVRMRQDHCSCWGPMLKFSLKERIFTSKYIKSTFLHHHAPSVSATVTYSQVRCLQNNEVGHFTEDDEKLTVTLTWTGCRFAMPWCHHNLFDNRLSEDEERCILVDKWCVLFNIFAVARSGSKHVFYLYIF